MKPGPSLQVNQASRYPHRTTAPAFAARGGVRSLVEKVGRGYADRFFFWSSTSSKSASTTLPSCAPPPLAPPSGPPAPAAPAWPAACALYMASPSFMELLVSASVL